MNFNILSFVKEQLSGYVIGKMSDFLGENPYKTASALENVLPVVLGGLVNKSSETQGAGQMMDQIKDAGHDGKVFDNLNDIVKDPDAMLDWLSSGSSLSNNIFGDKINSVIDGISGENDIRKTSAASLLSFLSPLVLGAVGKHVTGNSLGISGIIDLMNANRPVAEQSLTPDMKYALGLGAANAQAEKSGSTTKPAANTQAASNKKPSSSNNLLKWLLPLLLVGIMGGSAYYFLKKKRDDAGISFFDKWTKKDAVAPTVSTSEGDSLKLKLEQRRKNAELSDKATELSKSSSETTTTASSTSSGTMSLVDSLKQKLEQRKLRESGKTTESSSLVATTETKVEPPKVETKVEPPKVETKAPPKVETSKVETKALPKVETPKVETKPKKPKETSNAGFSSRTSSRSKNRNYSSTTNKRSYRNNLGTDIIEDLEGPSSYSPQRTYTTTTSSNSGSRGDLSSAIRSRSINAEFAIDGISFVNGGYEFTGSSKSELNRLANLLKSNPSARVFIQGFAMNGSAEDHELSQMRAEWVRYALIERGVKASNVEARGHGQSNQTSLGSIPRNKVSMKLIGI